MLLGSFFVLLVRAYLKGMQIDCGCFGSGDVISPRTLLRDGGLLAASLILVAVASVAPPQRHRRVSRAITSPSSVGMTQTSALAPSAAMLASTPMAASFLALSRRIPSASSDSQIPARMAGGVLADAPREDDRVAAVEHGGVGAQVLLGAVAEGLHREPGRGVAALGPGPAVCACRWKPWRGRTGRCAG